MEESEDEKRKSSGAVRTNQGSVYKETEAPSEPPPNVVDERKLSSESNRKASEAARVKDTSLETAEKKDETRKAEVESRKLPTVEERKESNATGNDRKESNAIEKERKKSNATGNEIKESNAKEPEGVNVLESAVEPANNGPKDEDNASKSTRQYDEFENAKAESVKDNAPLADLHKANEEPDLNKTANEEPEQKEVVQPELQPNQCVTCRVARPPNSLFKCVTCPLRSSHANLCNNCVAVHIRKKHEILDWKDFQPFICKEHETLSEFLCQTCNLVICVNCLISEFHSGHYFTNVPDQGTKVRQECSEYTSRLRMNERLIEHKNTQVRDILDRYLTEQKREQAYVEEQLKLLRVRVLEELAKFQNHELLDMQTSKSKTKELQEEAPKRQSQVEKFLDASEGAVIERFAALEQEVYMTIKEQENCLDKLCYVKNFKPDQEMLSQCVTRFIEDFIRSLGPTALRTASVLQGKEKDINIPDDILKRDSVTYLLNSRSFGFLNEIYESRVSIKVARWKFNKKKFKIELLNEDSYTLGGRVRKIYPLVESFKVVTDRGIFYFKIGDKKARPSHFCSKKNGLRPYTDPSWAYYEPSERMIRMTDDMDVKVSCDSKPTSFFNYTTRSDSYFITDNLDVIKICLETDRVHRLYRNDHGLPEIDYIYETKYGPRRFFVWCCKLKLVKILIKDENEYRFVVEDAFSWKKDRGHVRIETSYLNVEFVHFTCNRIVWNEERKCGEKRELPVVMITGMD